jgi:hypothetical protein
MAVIFSRIQLDGWRQFKQVDIDFHPRLTVITGANGSGKSTILGILSNHFGWSRPYLSVPKQDKRGTLSYLSGTFSSVWKALTVRPFYTNAIGSIRYSNGAESPIQINDTNSFQLGMTISNTQHVEGLLIDSHRPSAYYSQISQMPLQPMTATQAFNSYNAEMLNRYSGGYGSQGPIFRMKESLISMAIFGEGNRYVGRNEGILETFTGFNDILKSLLPESLGFESISIRNPEVVLVTKSGEFMLDASSGGLMTLIDVAWRIYMFSRNKSEFVVAMDEPENHLHPSMQRSLMRRLLEAFPGGQFIIATHSPFMVSSVKDSNVFVLRYQDTEEAKRLSPDLGMAAGRKVFSEKLTRANRAGNAGEVLREVLGVPATMPEWVEEELTRIVARYRGKKLSSELLDGLRADLTSVGYEEYYTDALADLTGAR